MWGDAMEKSVLSDVDRMRASSRAMPAPAAWCGLLAWATSPRRQRRGVW